MDSLIKEDKNINRDFKKFQGNKITKSQIYSFEKIQTHALSLVSFIRY